MVLKIDGRACDGGRTNGLGRYDDAELTQPFLRREGERVEIQLDDTPRNRAIFGNPDEGMEADRFNGERHAATVEVEGVPLMTGYARILEFSDKTGFRVEVHSPGASWAESAALGRLHATPVGWQGKFDFQTIAQTWEEGAPVCFLPVFRQGYEALHPSGYKEVERILPTSDYYPFLRLYNLMQAIFCRAGYKLVSEFFESEFFRSLYMSGAYAASDTAAMYNRYGFFARRKNDVSATANASGRVYTSLPLHQSSVGPVVDTFSPLETDASGQPMSDICNHGGTLVIENGEPIFKPRYRMKVSFRFHLEYTTDYRILSRTRLRGFDSFYLGEGVTLQGRLTNLFQDKRDEPLAAHSYTVVVFDAPSDGSYRVVDQQGAVMATFSGRTAGLVTASAWQPSKMVLQQQIPGGWVASPLDWALYNGSIGEQGRMRVEIDVTTPVEDVLPGGRHFHSVYFAGAEPGMTLTLHEGTTLGVDFSQRPGFGSLVHFNDIARHPIYQSVLVEALVHLFNLRVHTDTEAREIHIEPEATFYDRSRVIDWSDRVDRSQPVVRRDRATEERESRLYLYAKSVGEDDETADETGGTDEADGTGEIDGAGGTDGTGSAAGTPYAGWRAWTQSAATQDGCQRRTNPFFVAVREQEEFRVNAPSAAVIAVDQVEEEGYFTPVIVSFKGLQPLPAGEVWGWPAPDGYYPAAHFSKAIDGTSLRFDGSGEAVGLRRFHDHEEERRSFAQQVTLTLRLLPEEVALLRHCATEETPGCNSLFRLTAEPRGPLYLLRRITEYDPETHRARCLFEDAL